MFRPVLVFLLAASAAFAQDDPAEGKNDEPAKLGPEATAEYVDPDKTEAAGGGGEEAEVGDAEPADEKEAGTERAGDEQANEAEEEPSEDESTDANAETNADSETPDAALIAGALRFRSIGPALMSGRIGDVAVDQEDPNHWYVAVASGGLWKTTNAGTTFDPIFDDQSSYSMGCVTIDPTDHNTVWLGTGENNGGRHIGFGDGIYRSRDAGKSWKNMGLKGTERISKIVVDPRDNDIVFAAAPGAALVPRRGAGPVQDDRRRANVEERPLGRRVDRRDGCRHRPRRPGHALRRHLPAAPHRLGPARHRARVRRA